MTDGERFSYLRRTDPLPSTPFRPAALTPAAVLAAITQVRDGVVYDLARIRYPGMPLPEMHPGLQVLPYRTPHGLRNEPSDTWPHGENNTAQVDFTSDLVSLCTHTGAHIDAIGHIAVGPDATWPGGRASSDVGDFGLRSGDAAALTPIVTRGLLLDIAALLDVPALPAGYGISADDLRAAEARQRVEVRRDDAVLIRTGYGSVWPDRELVDRHAGAGLTLEAAEYLMAKDVVAVGADTEGVEQLPSTTPGNPHPVHVALLNTSAIPMLEVLDLERLAADQRWTSLFIATPVKLRGATAGLTDPIAIA